MNLIVDGREVYAYTGGKPFDPALPCVVFIHGALHDHGVWNLLARWFAHHGRSVLAVDLPGHMRSAGPPLASVEVAADWVLALLDAAGVKQAALAGHSMGSLIALEAAARAPTRITHLAMLGTAYPMKVSPALLEASLTEPSRAIEMVTRFGHSTLAPKPGFPGPGNWLRGGYRSLMHQVLARQENRALFHHDFSVCDRYVGGFEAAARVVCPSTLILGTHDQMTWPHAATELARALKARVVQVPAGHSLMAEAPDQVLNSLRAALA